MNRQRASSSDRDRERRRRDEEIVAREDFTALLSTEEGRRVAWRVLQQTQETTPVFNVNAMVMSANAGKQEIGLWLREQLRSADRDNYYRMLTENDA